MVMDKLYRLPVPRCGCSGQNALFSEVVMDRQSHSGKQTGTQIRSIGGRLSLLLLTLLWQSQPLQAQPAPAQSSPTAAPAAASPAATAANPGILAQSE